MTGSRDLDPIETAVRELRGGRPMTFPFDYRERTPGGDLGRAVASAWYARGTVPYRREQVAPTGSTVAVIVLGDPIVETAGAPRAVPFRAAEGFLIGPHDRPATNEPTGETFAMGVVTTPVGARAALGVDPARVAGQVVELAAWWPAATGLRRDLLELGRDPDAMLDRLVAALEAGLALDIPGLERCERAVAMLAEAPARPIADVAAALGVSHGHLDREFTRIVGLSPKRLARLFRVERLIAALGALPSVPARAGVAGSPGPAPVPWAALAADLGWADQSHLIRDFRRHTGSSPSAYLAAQRWFTGSDGAPEAGRFVPEPM